MTPSVSLSTVQETIRRALVRYPEERARIERAAVIVAKDRVRATGPDTFGVTSQTHPGSAYCVTVDPARFWAVDCACEDARRRPALQCKHQWAATLILVAQERQRRLDLSAAFTADELARLTELRGRRSSVEVA